MCNNVLYIWQRRKKHVAISLSYWELKKNNDIVKRIYNQRTVGTPATVASISSSSYKNLFSLFFFARFFFRVLFSEGQEKSSFSSVLFHQMFLWLFISLELLNSALLWRIPSLWVVNVGDNGVTGTGFLYWSVSLSWSHMGAGRAVDRGSKGSKIDGAP